VRERPLRFCMVTTFYPPYHFGGDAVFVHRLAQALAEEGHIVDVVHSIDAYRLQAAGEPAVPFADHVRVTRHGLESRHPRLTASLTHQLGAPAAYGRRLRDVLERDYDVIHYHNVSLAGGPDVLRLGRALKLYTAHEYWLVCPTHVLFAFDRTACTARQCLPCVLSHRRVPQAWRYTDHLARALESVDRLLMPSRFAMERHRADGIARPMVHLPHFVPDAAMPTGVHEGRTEGRPFFLYVGRLERLKGVQDLVSLFADYPHADLVIAGDGSFRGALEEGARGLPHVRFLGPVHPSRLADLYRRAVGLLVPSRCYETFGLAAAEAMSHGTPVIVRRIGALAEMVEESGGGLVFDTLDECRAAMEGLRLGAERRAELGRRGRIRARERWSRRAHLRSYLGLVRVLLAGGAARPSAVRRPTGAGAIVGPESPPAEPAPIPAG
jgi:glycosyltransferase involved in cell wall biosynthesis